MENTQFSMSQQPRIVFLIPIASRRVSRDWGVACALFRQTLASVFNSSSDNFKVVVAGHEPPDFALPDDPRMKFISLDHPVPSPGPGFYVAVVRDKMIKLAAAWEYAKAAWNPDYVMKLDWDDLVSSRLVDWLEKADNAAGYRINQGWIWRSNRYFIQRTEHLDRFCGSCVIIRRDLVDCEGPFLNSVDGVHFDEAGQRFEAEDQYSLVPGAGRGKLLLTDSHTRTEAQFACLGHPLPTVPFGAVIWRIGHGQNASHQLHQVATLRMWLGRLRRTRILSPQLRREFALAGDLQ
jgi:hypothetical protein